MAHVFISYKKQDRKFVELIEQKLKESDIDVWTDAEIHAGEDWRAKIDEAIHNSFVLLVVMSKNARKSEYVTYEWAYALGRGVEIIIVLSEKMSVHPKLDLFQHLDFSTRGGENWDKLIDSIKEFDKPSGVRDALKNLTHFYPEYRRDALKLLVNAQYKDAIPQIINALDDNSPIVRVTAIEAVSAWHIDEAEDKILNIFLSESIERNEKRACVNALSKVGAEKTGNALIEILETAKDFEDIDSCIEILGNMKYEKAIEAIIKTHELETGRLRRLGRRFRGETLIVALKSMNQASLEKVFSEILSIEEYDEKVKEKTIELIGVLSKREFISTLQEIVEAGKSNLKEYAIHALGRLEDITSLPILHNFLKSRDFDLRNAALEAVGNIASGESIQPLVEALSENELNIDDETIERFVKFHSIKVMPLLVKKLQAGHFIRDNIKTIIKNLVTRETIHDLLILLIAKKTRNQADIIDILIAVEYDDLKIKQIAQFIENDPENPNLEFLIEVLRRMRTKESLALVEEWEKSQNKE